MNTWKYTPNHAAVGWKCAACGTFITEIEDGWVEWLAGEDEQGHAKLSGLRLVHRLTASPDGIRWRGCQYNKHHEFKKGQNIVEGLSLGRFVGPDGLMLLLSLIAEDELPTQDVLELAKRVQIPGYEQARDLFQTAIAHGIIEPSIGMGFYLQSEIQTLLHWSVKRAV